MVSLLRQIVASPRFRHPEAGLDLCYVTDFIIATSGPSQTYPALAYRTPLDQLVAFLDLKHGQDWAIWEFRAEGTGYPDDAVYNRIWHYPWPDHHPPPFRLVPLMMASMRNWLHGGAGVGKDDSNAITTTETKTTFTSQRNEKRVVVVHCKAGKGRSGTASCSYLIAEEGWMAEDALRQFSERRMRPQFGAGVSIPSQLRWVGYVDRWTRGGKKYVDRRIEIVEIRISGLRNGVKVDVEGFADEGKRIEVVHAFTGEERVVEAAGAPGGGGISEMMWDLAGYPVQPEDKEDKEDKVVAVAAEDQSAASEESVAAMLRRKGLSLMDWMSPQGEHSKVDRVRARMMMADSSASAALPPRDTTEQKPSSDESEPGGMTVVFRPKNPLVLGNSDVNVSVERRNRSSKSMGLTMVTALAHVWFNAFFEGGGAEKGGRPDDEGRFEIDWEAMDGIKGSSRKGTRALDRLCVVWRAADREGQPGQEIAEPREGEFVPQVEAADWHGVGGEERELGLMVENPLSADVSGGSSLRSGGEEMKGVKTSGPSGEEL